MKPKRIYLIRHGESVGNVDPIHYNTTPHYQLALSEKGQKQAVDLGKKLGLLLRGRSVAIYSSPLWRARDTTRLMVSQFQNTTFTIKEDPRLRTQAWGPIRTDDENRLLLAEREEYGVFHFHVPGGESCAYVYDRVASFMESVFQHTNRAEEDIVIVTHGMTLRLILMYVLELTVEEFENYLNPDNCVVLMVEQRGGRYVLTNPGDIPMRLVS
jgi:broad specificity phosphatase PhoE